MILIILLVLFTVVLGVWALSLLGAIPHSSVASGWLAFSACLILGIVVFLTGSGYAVIPR